MSKPGDSTSLRRLFARQCDRSTTGKTDSGRYASWGAVDLNSTVRETHKLLRRLIPVSIDLIPKLQGDLGKVKADPAQVQQILINLLGF